MDVAPESASLHRDGARRARRVRRLGPLALGLCWPCEPVLCAACQTRSLDTSAAHATCCAGGEATRGHNVIARLRWRSLDSSVALTSGQRMSSPLPWTIHRQPLRSRSAPCSAGWLPTARRQTRGRTCVLCPTSGNAALGKFGLAGHLQPFGTLWTLKSKFLPGALGPVPPVVSCPPAPCAPFSWSVSLKRHDTRSCLFSAVLRAWFRALATSWAKSLGSLAAQWSTLAALEASASHGVQALQEAPLEPVDPIPATGLAPRLAHLRPRSRSRSPQPRAALSRPRGSILVNQRGPAGLSVKSSLVLGLLLLPLPDLGLCYGPVESRSAAGAGPNLRTVRASPLGRLVRGASGAAEARQRRRDKHRCRVRRDVARNLVSRPRALCNVGLLCRLLVRR